MKAQRKKYLGCIIFLAIATLLSLPVAYADYDDPGLSCEIENEPNYNQGIVDNIYGASSAFEPSYTQPDLMQLGLFPPQTPEDNTCLLPDMPDMPIINELPQFNDKIIDNPQDPNLTINPLIDNMPIIEEIPPSLNRFDPIRDLDLKTTEYNAMPDNQLWAYNEYNDMGIPDTGAGTFANNSYAGITTVEGPPGLLGQDQTYEIEDATVNNGPTGNEIIIQDMLNRSPNLDINTTYENADMPRPVTINDLNNPNFKLDTTNLDSNSIAQPIEQIELKPGDKIFNLDAGEYRTVLENGSLSDLNRIPSMYFPDTGQKLINNQDDLNDALQNPGDYFRVETIR